MNKNDSGKSVIDINCFCESKHCEGNLYIQSDTLQGERCFIVTVIDYSGDAQGDMWLSVKQMRQLIKELSILVVESEEVRDEDN
jgi:hypothetical protein